MKKECTDFTYFLKENKRQPQLDQILKYFDLFGK